MDAIGSANFSANSTAARSVEAPRGGADVPRGGDEAVVGDERRKTLELLRGSGLRLDNKARHPDLLRYYSGLISPHCTLTCATTR